MKKEFLTLTLLSSIVILVYFLFPNIQDERQKKEKFLEDENIITENSSENYIDERKSVSLTFDIVRISKIGDAVIAGKSHPNINIDLLSNDKVIANFFSDANGEWIWVSDSPIVPGEKRFKLRHTDEKNNEHESDQVILVLDTTKNDFKSSNKVLLKSSSNNTDILNLELVQDGLSLDMANLKEDGLFILTGRTLPQNEIKFFKSNKIVGKVISDLEGKWNFEYKSFNPSPEELIIVTDVKEQEISLSFSEKDLIKFINAKNKFYANKITVQPGNSLWRIARKTLGDGMHYSEIYLNNITRIKDPNLIFPGQVFNIPRIRKTVKYE